MKKIFFISASLFIVFTSCTSKPVVIACVGDIVNARTKHNVVHPVIIAIKLGTNDSKPYNCNSDVYKKNYQSIIDRFLTHSPSFFSCLIVPIIQGSRFK